MTVTATLRSPQGADGLYLFSTGLVLSTPLKPLVMIEVKLPNKVLGWLGPAMQQETCCTVFIDFGIWVRSAWSSSNYGLERSHKIFCISSTFQFAMSAGIFATAKSFILNINTTFATDDVLEAINAVLSTYSTSLRWCSMLWVFCSSMHTHIIRAYFWGL